MEALSALSIYLSLSLSLSIYLCEESIMKPTKHSLKGGKEGEG
jgi:hypothetical protein